MPVLISFFLQCVLNVATGEDYKLLENMNTLTKERYSELAGMAQQLMQEVGKLRTTCMNQQRMNPCS